ncbi:MAG: hypothetical protein QNJ54_06060 [Prochloraceae cyanobacterium]|nr:hypothetical protein [Prochloraceae cyanobacterium]
MKLVDVFNFVERKYSEVANFVTYPGQVLYMRARLLFHHKMREIDVPIGDDKSSRQTSRNNRKNRNKDLVQEFQERASEYKRFLPGGDDRDREESVEPQNKSRRSRRRRSKIAATQTEDPVVVEVAPGEIPPLQEGQEIRGRRGRYKCSGEILLQEQTVRVYKGIHTQSNKAVIIKEYLLLDRDYNEEERRACKEKFANVSNINFRNGSSKDFRIFSPIEAIAPPREKRCYLITQPVENSITLKEYIEREGSLAPSQVVSILDQVLQTLWFLHTNRIRLPSNNQVQKGIPHGNLNLSTISIVLSESYSENSDEPLPLAYVSDLAVWEHLFLPPNSPSIKTSVSQDLADLGTVSFHLLAGETVDSKTNLPLDPRDEENWPYTDEVLIEYIERLLRINGKFQSAFVARQELLKLKNNKEFEYQNIDETETEVRQNYLEEATKKVSPITGCLTLLGLLGVLGLIGGGSYFLVNRFFIAHKRAYKHFSTEEPAVCCFNKVKLANGQFDYTVSNGIWERVFDRRGAVQHNVSLKQELENRDPILKQYKYIKYSNEDPIEALKNGDIDFALGRWNENLSEDLEQEIVAYHGLAVFVAYSDDLTKKSLPKAFSGKISLDDLRKLYTGKGGDWKQPKEVKDWKVKLYAPFEMDAIALFEEILFGSDRSDKIEEYREFTDRIISRQKQTLSEEKIDRPRTGYLLGEVFQDFENQQTVGIGFSYLSTIFGQCSVYPLAIVKDKKEIQPLATVDGKAISTKTDLCDDKGGYWPNVEAFKSQQYALGYSLVVVYPKNDKERALAGKRFADFLKTDEGQYLLREAGLVPLRVLP